MSIQQKLDLQLSQFTGTQNYYREARTGLHYTDGAKFLADTYHCHWLFFEIFLYNCTNDPEEFQVWKFQRHFTTDNKPTDSFTLTMEDGNNNVIHSKIIPFSDFAADNVNLWFSNNVLYLPSEH